MSETNRTDIIKSSLHQKDWLKKLENASGKPVVLGKNKPGKNIVYLLIDCSTSMIGDKIEQAKNGSIEFAIEAQKKEYSVGIISFSSSARYILEPQNKTDSFIAQIREVYAGGSTNMADAIWMAIEKLNKCNEITKEKVLCIITDGMPDSKKDALKAAQVAKRNGIDIITIGTDDADRDFLEELASIKELSQKVSRDKLQSGILSMAKLLPEK